MPLSLDDMREEFANFLFNNGCGTKFVLDKALAHVVSIAYRRGYDEGVSDTTRKLTDDPITPRY